MSDNANITREDLVAIAYELYSSICASFDKPHISPQDFEANCNGNFKFFSNSPEE